MCDALAALHERRLEIKQRNADVNALLQRHCAGDAVNGDGFIGERNVRAQADDDVLEILYFVRVGVVYQVAELNNVRPLYRVHALAVLGGESGGFGVKYHDLHCDCVACIAYALVLLMRLIMASLFKSIFFETSTDFRTLIY